MTRTSPGVNAQLRAFYDAQGLTGQHRRRAMQHDRRRIREVAIHETGQPFTPTMPCTDTLDCAFVWWRTKEGHGYWLARREAGAALQIAHAIHAREAGGAL